MHIINGGKMKIITNIILMSMLGFASIAQAENARSQDIKQYHQILDAIKNSEVPEDVKNQLFRDMKTNLIENIRQSNAPEEVKQNLIKDLENTSRN